MTANNSVRTATAIADPNNPANVLKPQSDGSLNVNATVSATIGDFALANAADPAWVEGALVEASVDLSGHQRVIAAATNTLVGAVNETAPATDTASSGLNGRLQRIAQRITALIGTAGTPSANVLTVQGVTSGTILATQTSFLFSNITTTTTTVVKSGVGVLRGITVNTLGSVASTVTIYDNTAGSGTKIGTINSLTLSGQFEFDIAFATGLTVVTTGAPDITVAYR